jgi:hypothetical protein
MLSENRQWVSLAAEMALLASRCTTIASMIEKAGGRRQERSEAGLQQIDYPDNAVGRELLARTGVVRKWHSPSTGTFGQ